MGQKQLGGFSVLSDLEPRLDPVTAIGIGVSVVEKISSFNGERKSKKAMAAIAAALASIKGDLIQIKLAIAEVKNSIAAIEKKIDDLPALQALQEVQAIQDTVRENYPAWSNTVTAAELEEVRRLRLDLQTADRRLIHAGGYSYAFNLAQAFMYELNLALLAKTDKVAVEASKSAMVEYLKESIDASVPGSLRDRYLRAKAIMDELVDWESKLVREEFLHSSWHNNDEDSWGYERCKSDFYKVILGSLRDGFQVVTQMRNTSHCHWTKWKGGIQPIIGTEDLSHSHSAALRLVAQSELDIRSKLYGQTAPVVRFIAELIAAIEVIIGLIEKRVAEQAALT